MTTSKTKWENIVKVWQDVESKNGDEKKLQTEFIEKVFKEILGYTDAEVRPEDDIAAGRNPHAARADCLIKTGESGNQKISIEFKRIGIENNGRGDTAPEGQLFSYVNQHRSIFGLLIGSSLVIYYDPSKELDEPVKIARIKFELNAEDGPGFVEAISSANFKSGKFEEFCKAEWDKKNSKVTGAAPESQPTEQVAAPEVIPSVPVLPNVEVSGSSASMPAQPDDTGALLSQSSSEHHGRHEKGYVPLYPTEVANQAK